MNIPFVIDNQQHRLADVLNELLGQSLTEQQKEESDVFKEFNTLLDPSGVEVLDNPRRIIKSEVGARAITDLMAWYERRWAESVDFKEELIELLDASKFGTKEYTPYEVYTKALYEYFKEGLGEVVHPRTFNTLRRIRDEDGAVLDEEEARAELAGPEMLLKHLKDLLNRDGANALTSLPHGIHSGLRREKCFGMFFYFQAPRSGEGKCHFWRYIDAGTHEVKENRYEIAQIISCLPDEARYIGDQDVFLLQDRVIDHILASDREAEAKAAAVWTRNRPKRASAFWVSRWAGPCMPN